NITKSNASTRESTKSESSKSDVGTSSSGGALSPEAKDGSAHEIVDVVSEAHCLNNIARLKWQAVSLKEVDGVKIEGA
ncbi:jg456, partial [Pararge aegeria aegeria]